MTNDKLDTSQGWCCDGRTYAEHAHTDGHCCQPKDTKITDLPDEARAKAEERLKEADSQSG